MTDYDLQQKLIEQRRQQYGQQAQFQAPQGQMVSGHFVAPNALQYLAAGLRSIGGMRGEELAGQQLQDLQKQRTEGTQKALANFLRQAQGTPENAPGDGMGPTMPAQAPNMSAAFAELIKSPDREMQQAALSGMVKIPEMQAARDDRIAAREAQAQQRMQELQFQHESRMQIMREQNASREQMAREQREHAASMAKLVASLRPSPAPRQDQIIQTSEGPMRLVNGQAVPIVGVNGQPVKAPPKPAGNLSATAQKELFEADDAVQAGEGAVSALKQALALNNKAYSGVGASTRAAIMSNIPGSYEGADATVALDNLIKEQALGSMKSIFGGNPTEGERAVLLELQASANKTPGQRQEILNRAVKAAEMRIAFNKQKADALRTGTYMTQSPETKAGASDLAAAAAAELARRRGGK